MNANVNIAIITDFGTRDGYVGAMKGVLNSICPQAVLIDITHEIAPQDVVGAAYTLARCSRYFPDATIFLVVVDPGVGTNRRPIAVEAGSYRFVAPDNGVLTKALQWQEKWRAVNLTNCDYWLDTVSATFHGRDIFAPVAAHWANGNDIVCFGKEVSDLVTLTEPVVRWDEEICGFLGTVIQVDQFGNLITNIGPLERLGQKLRWQENSGQNQEFSGEAFTVELVGLKLRGIRKTYGEVNKGGILALVDSNGYLEIAMNQGNAAETLGIEPGAEVTLRVWR